MNELFAFLSRHSKWFVLAIYLVLSSILLFNSDPYRHHLWLSSSSAVSGSVYSVGNSITSYFNLRDTNDDLNRRNAELEAQVVNLREEVNRLRLAQFTDTMPTPDSVQHFNFIVANVINNSIHHPHNYITIDKGTADGVVAELGVIDHSGVVGVVSVAGEHYSQVISLLNPNFRRSCKIRNTEHFGSLVWDGVDPTVALLEELPRHTRFVCGDTVVTSGFSAVFPAGIPVGTILDNAENHKENFFTIKVKLFADFTRLSNVQVVINNRRDQITRVEQTRVYGCDADPANK